MRINSLYTNIGVAVATLVLGALLLVGSSNVLAQSSESTDTTANTLRVSPLRTDVEADPGGTTTLRVTVTNPTDNDIMVNPIQNDFVAEDEDGTPALILEEDEYAPKRSLKRLLQPLEAVLVPAGESRQIEVTINVPADAEAGGYFGAVRFAPTDPDTGGQVNMSASVASLILLRVNGDLPESLALTDFDLQQNGVPKAFLTSPENLTYSVRFKNESDVQLAPIGKVSIVKGDTIVYEDDFNAGEQRGMILPESARRWSASVTDVSSFGKYTISGTFTYGTTNQTIDVSKTFWMVPIAFIIGGAVLLLLVVAAIVLLILRNKKQSSGVSLRSRR